MSDKAIVFFNILLVVFGICAVIGGGINFKNGSGVIVIVGGIAIGAGMVILGVKGLANCLKSK